MPQMSFQGGEEVRLQRTLLQEGEGITSAAYPFPKGRVLHTVFQGEL